MNLAARSRFINIRPIEVQRGWPPEKYVITYTCRGIAGIDEHSLPRESEFHEVSMYMGSEYPLKEPYLKWLTPIWHPNIAHEEPHHVCTNNVQNWFAAKPLAELVLAMGEMVQFKHYHAKWIAPFPLDRAAAEWVLGVAEPKGILGPNKPFDDRPLLQMQRMRKTRMASAIGSLSHFNKGLSLGHGAMLMRSIGGARAIKATDLRPSLYSAKPAERKRPLIKFGKAKTEAGVPVSTADTVADRTTKRLEPRDDENTSNGPQPDSLYSIEVLRDGQLQRTEQVARSLITIGRGALGTSVDLVLEGDPTMSRLHAILERDERGSFWLTVKGQNPVTVNNRVLPQDRSIAVDPGQLIEICSYSIKLVS